MVAAADMGTADREYHQETHRRAMPPMPPVTKTLLIANLTIYFADILFFNKAIANFFYFSIESAFAQFRLWELLSFQFLHGSVAHVAFNSIALYFFGPLLERELGSRRYLAFYLLCGIAGALLFTALTLLQILPNSVTDGLVGASAGIYGILIAIAVIAPNLQVSLLIPPVTLRMRTLALIILGIAVAVIVFSLGSNEGGEAGHLGGAILGWFLIRHPRLLAWADGRRPRVDITRPKAFRQRSESKLRPRSEIDLARQSRVDELLDKISRDGFQSLSEAEREFLRQASKSTPRHDDR